MRLKIKYLCRLYLFPILILTAGVSCGDKDTQITAEKRLAKLEKENSELSVKIEKVNDKYIKPFEYFQTILLEENKNSPHVSIGKYEILIETYSNTYWAHEAMKRIKNIRARTKYWSEEGGWNFPKEIIDDERIETPQGETISCPGC